MPELPEVETIRHDLGVLVGQKLLSSGKRLKQVDRKGKYIFLLFEDESLITIHLGMTGQLLLNQKGKYEREFFQFEKDRLSFSDMRKFGHIWYERRDLSHVGTDALKISEAEFLEKLKKGTLKATLLSQKIVAGIGNIYADEICFASGIRPDRKVENLSVKEKKALYKGMKRIFKKAISLRGTTFSDYRDGDGKKGEYQKELKVYGRGEKSCLECGGILQKIKIAGRTTVFCERCQE